MAFWTNWFNRTNAGNSQEQAMQHDGRVAENRNPNLETF